jgi:negative regulator of sigma E activity
MNDALKIQISAFVDGELPENESELLLRRLSQDALLRRQVAQYLEIGRLLRNDRKVPGIDELRGRIAATLGDEMHAEPAGREVIGSRFMTPATGIAVAATVAALALVGLGQLDTPADTGFEDAVAIDSAPIYTEPAVADALGDNMDEQLREYYRRHENNSDELARMVNFEIGDNLVEIEPDEHLRSASRQTAPESANDDSSQQLQE